MRCIDRVEIPAFASQPQEIHAADIPGNSESESHRETRHREPNPWHVLETLRNSEQFKRPTFCVGYGMLRTSQATSYRPPPHRIIRLPGNY